MFDLFLLFTPFLLLLIVALLRFIGCNQILGNQLATLSPNSVAVTVVPNNWTLGPGETKQFSELVAGTQAPDAENAETWSPGEDFPFGTNIGKFKAPYPWAKKSVEIMASYNGDLGTSSTPGTATVTLDHANVAITPSGIIQVMPAGSQAFQASALNVTPPLGGSINYEWSMNGKVVQAFSPTAKYTYSAPAPPYVVTPPITISFKINADSAPTGTNSATVMFVGNGATFVKTDTTTKGNWKGTYGAKGYALANSPSNLIGLPFFLKTFTPPPMEATFSLAPEPQDLQNPASSGAPLQSVWYTDTTLQIDLLFTDYAIHEISVYFAEWGGNPRTETVAILDADNPLGPPLNSQQLDDKISSFVGGVYLVWQVTGHVILQITNNSTGANAVVCGIFFDS
jgi:hypothetical protein